MAQGKKAYNYLTPEEFNELTKDMKECKINKNIFTSSDGKTIVEYFPDITKWYDTSLKACLVKHIVEGIGKNNKGYYLVHTKPGDRLVHRLVADAWLDESINGKEVNHKNGKKWINCVSNLEIVTHSENMKHAWVNGLMKSPSKHCRYSRKSHTLFYTNGTQEKMSEREYCIWRTQHNLPIKGWMKEYAK